MSKVTLYDGFVPEFGVTNVENRLGIDSLPLNKKLTAMRNKKKISNLRNMDMYISENNEGDPQTVLEKMEDQGLFNVQETILVVPDHPVSRNQIQTQTSFQNLFDEPDEKYTATFFLGEEMQNLFDKNIPVFPSNSRSMLRCAHKNYKKIQRQKELSKKERAIQIVRRPARRESLLEETGVLFS